MHTIETIVEAFEVFSEFVGLELPIKHTLDVPDSGHEDCYGTSFKKLEETLSPGGVHNMFRVWVCAAHMGGFLGPKFSKQGSFFGRFSIKQWWVIQKLAKNSKKWVVFRQNSS